MKALKSHRGILAPLDRSNVDTDQIIPKQFLKSIARTGFGEQLFFDWRYLENGKPNPGFVLNQPRYKSASILVARNNFGSGSSREHAVWAVEQYGFQVVVAASFADIFRNNCSKNAVLTVELKEAEVDQIFKMVERYPGLEATADVQEQRLVLHLEETEEAFHFDIDPAVKERLVHGLDDIGLTLKHLNEISSFEAKYDPQISKV